MKCQCVNEALVCGATSDKSDWLARKLTVYAVLIYVLVSKLKSCKNIKQPVYFITYDHLCDSVNLNVLLLLLKI